MGIQGAVPFLTPQGFTSACQQVEAAYRRASTYPLGIELHRQHGECYLKLKRTLRVDDARDIHEELQENVDDEDLGIDAEVDEAAIDSVDESRLFHALVEYDVILSPTYQVPVLYFKPFQLSPRKPLALDFVYQCLVSSPSIAQLQETSVMGGITAANHPFTDVPWFFIHPCSTPDAMREILGTRTVSELEYLQIWIGLIGSCVGLYLPKELAMKNNGID